MKRLALFTALALASPLVADAQPRPDPRGSYDRDRDHDRDRDRDRFRDRHDHDQPAFRWVPIWRGYTAFRDREFIPVRGGRWDRLRIEAERGRPVIYKIAVEFFDRTIRVFEVNATLVPGTAREIDLPGRDRQIRRIIVFADPRSRGTYSIFGT